MMPWEFLGKAWSATQIKSIDVVLLNDLWLLEWIFLTRCKVSFKLCMHIYIYTEIYVYYKVWEELVNSIIPYDFFSTSCYFTHFLFLYLSLSLSRAYISTHQVSCLLNKNNLQFTPFSIGPWPDTGLFLLSWILQLLLGLQSHFRTTKH